MYVKQLIKYKVIMKAKVLFVSILTVLFLSNALISTAQKKTDRTIEDFEIIKDSFEIDNNGNVTYVKVIKLDSMSKDDIFMRARNYFVYNYNSGKAVIQTEDKENGLLVGKGLYSDVHSKVMALGQLFYTFDTWHILRIDVKEGRARIILSLTNYEVQARGASSTPEEVPISGTYPINNEFKAPKNIKNMYLQAFMKSHDRVISTLKEVEKSLKEGNTSSDIENEDW